MENSHPSQSESGSHIASTDALDCLARTAEALGAPRLARDARALAERIADQRFFVACIGQFKRGKSTLLNALAGTRVLPTGVVPVTAIVTVLRYGPVERAEVHFETGAREQIPCATLADYVSEERNPANQKGVAVVEVFVPGQLLASGMCLVDTPGIGSVFAGNTAVTREFVPHIDAAMVVLGADPPISGDELALVEEVAAQVSEFIFVLNKAERLSEAECAAALKFCREIVSNRIAREIKRVYRVSALDWLDGAGPSRDAPELCAELQRLARESGPALVTKARQRGIKRIKTGLLREIDSQRDALRRPIEDSRRLVEHLSETIADAERSLGDLNYLFKAEHERVARKCVERRDRFLADAIPAAREEFHQAIAASRERGAAAIHARATVLAQQISRRLLDRWLEQERPAAESLYTESARRFIGLANEFLNRLADSGDPALASLPRTVSAEAGFRVRARPYFGEHFGFPRRTAARWLGDLLRPRARRLEIVEKDVVRYLDTLLSLNSTRALNDLDEIVRESSRRLEAEIRSLLKELRTTAENTLLRAQKTHAAGSKAVSAELQRLNAMQNRLCSLPDAE